MLPSVMLLGLASVPRAAPPLPTLPPVELPSMLPLESPPPVGLPQALSSPPAPEVTSAGDPLPSPHPATKRGIAQMKPASERVVIGFIDTRASRS